MLSTKRAPLPRWFAGMVFTFGVGWFAGTTPEEGLLIGMLCLAGFAAIDRLLAKRQTGEWFGDIE